ncbi:MAG: glycosyltransferase [Candidatus Omnitrophica bacterium]|nr:glycosyltransferase [Candidatus Omnitrophota bacterium]
MSGPTSRVSIIIPVYNSEKTVGEALDSVAAQTYTDYEVIVVNDGSTDQSESAIKKYMSPPLNVTYVEQVNNGPAAARNAGLRLAKGEFVAFLDADDLWDKDKLATAIEAMDANPDAKLVFTDMRHVVNGRTVYASYLHERPYPSLPNGKIYDNLLWGNFIFTPTVLVRRDVLREVGGFDENLQIAEDYDLWLRIARRYPIHYIDRPLVTRRRIGGNITDDKQTYIKSCIRLREKLLEVHKEEPGRCRIIEGQLKRDRYNLGYVLFDAMNFKESRKFFFQTLVYPDYFLNALFYIIVTLLPAGIIKFLRQVKRGGE